MPQYKSPGQKRKRWVQIIALMIFIAASYAGSLFMQKFHNQQLAWTDDHQVVAATVTGLDAEDEEYRNLKGRLRHRTVYYLTYEFNVDEISYENMVEISAYEFEQLTLNTQVDVWYATTSPNINDTADNVNSDLSSNDDIGNTIDVLPYTGPASLFIYWVMTFIFVKESKKALPKGFYTETSWLDIDDNYLVALDGNDLVMFDIDGKQASKVQSSYQNGASIEELMAISKSDKFKRIPLSEIKELVSDHNSDVLTIEWGEESESVEFLNQTVKAHALERIQPLLSNELQYHKLEKSRLGAATPALILLAIFTAIAYFASIFWLTALIGFICLVKVIPRIIVRLWDPTVRQSWKLAETVADACTE
ncbi:MULTISPECIES: hypothetical protein [Corallincola]|uniref:DUF2207 domain-containing protein n=2 Tax=Corallincola TaxID=1775176 RepID=A0ABY1WQF9_9GAMM|nr:MULTISPECIES: hypothetical protein [Corallincola]TAA46960.1 hypothetical protein EXY25_06815 [Corallincola spongiicola]TCI04611.1 hypothetical protein EZV61_01125 [Corallincola luteus]